MTETQRRKHIKGKPHPFQNGFVANRIARAEAPKYPDAAIDVFPVRHGQRGRLFLIRKIAGEDTTYWVSAADGFLPIG